MKIKAAVLYQPRQPLVVEEVDLDPPKRGEVLVRVAAAGVCRSDYHFMVGENTYLLPVVLGHEGAGIVEAVGEGVTTVKPGDPVIFNFVPNCGFCAYCTAGRPNICENSATLQQRAFMLDGTSRLRKGKQVLHHFIRTACFAEYAVLAETGCIPLEKDFPLDHAALIGCSVTTGVCAVLRTAQVPSGASVAVVGCGGVGLNVIQGARLVNADPIIAIDIREGNLALARQLGATHTINAGTEHVLRRVQEITNGQGADYSFEVYGGSHTAQVAFDIVRRGGTVVIVGLAPEGHKANFDLITILRKEVTIKGSYYGSARPRLDMPMLVRLAKEGRLDIGTLAQRRYRLEQINQAYRDLEEGLPGRGIIVFPQ
ncbi:MAG: Zn-dependent alcohol dehydrogenase [Dehalococcoidia bacterium]|nr:Zn-dependent alcohol dehydrogenase [Dehalococcoidia bacterium]MDW8120484.1 Zn-dependent alcohol dehydrogenase [Chloroflexota bacterium]